MFIITVNGKEKDGAYSVIDDDGEQVLYLFHQEDDVMIKTCEIHDHRYAIIDRTDIVIPPQNALDFIK